MHLDLGPVRILEPRHGLGRIIFEEDGVADSTESSVREATYFVAAFNSAAPGWSPACGQYAAKIS